MSKPTEFYTRFVEAVFRRGKADTLPYTYINREAGLVLKPDELAELHRVIDSLVEQGKITRKDDTLTLVQQV